MDRVAVKSVKQVTHKRQTSNKIFSLIKILKEVFSLQKESISFFLFLNFVDCIYKLLNVQMNVDFFGERHSTGMAYNLFNRSLVNLCFRKH